MAGGSEARKGFYGWLGDTLENRSAFIILGTILITLLLLYPFIMMPPEETASDNPTDNEVVQLSDYLEDTFSREILWVGFIVEARDGDMLTRRNLEELWQSEEAIKRSELAEYLYLIYNEAAGTSVPGMYSLADALNAVIINESGGLADISSGAVTDDQVKMAIEYILADPDAGRLHDSLSVLSKYDEEAGWSSPALVVSVLSNDVAVLTDYLDEGVTVEEATPAQKDYAREAYALRMQEIMRGDQIENQVWGIAIDLEHEIEDESGIAGALLFAALLLMAVLLLIVFRSLPIMLLTIMGLGMLIVWMKGLSNLIGLEKGLVVDVILPVAIVVLGVDYAIQALFRYREERNRVTDPRRALGNSTSRVGRALVLAMFTTVVAFISNASSGIESVVDFAVAASIAILTSFVLLGLFVPALTMRWRVWRSRGDFLPPGGAGVRVNRLGRLIAVVSDGWFLVLPVSLVVTGLAAWGWLNVETKMDASDALRPDSDFVVSLDKWDIHGADKGGEPTLLYFEGDLTRLEAVHAIQATIAQMNRDDEEPYVGFDPITGEPNADALLLDMLEALMENGYARGRIEEATGVAITDNDGDRLPDTELQLEAVYDYVIEHGLPQDATTLRYRPTQVAEAFVRLGSGDYAATMSVGIPGTREQAVVRSSARELNSDMAVAMEGVRSIRKYGLTGSGNIRVAQFDAVSEALTGSLIIAVAAVLGLLLVIFRSIKYAVLTIIPVLLVATWLYGFMYLAGYSLNILTATIAAISVGVGIDFSIHFTERFREEVGKGFDKRSAIRRTAQSTGYALFCTALTTILGFVVIAFAPMPMFSTFGILTAIMIALSLFMALVILPGLLRVFAPSMKRRRRLF